MPEYDATDMPEPIAADLRPDTPTGEPNFTIWPASRYLPEAYDGPPPAREYDAGMPTHGDGVKLRGRSVQPPATTDNSAVMPSIVPPPGHG